jgi:ribonuclease R
MKQKKPAPRTLDEVRGAILTILTRQAPNQLKSNELSKLLGIAASDPEYDLVRQALEGLEETGEIFRGSRRRYGVVIPETVIEGRLKMLRAGQWCIVPDDGPQCEVDIDARHLWTALHGDRVVAKLLGTPEPGEIPHGEITRVVERGLDRIVGTLKRGRGFFVDADDRKIHRTFNVARNQIGTARVGDKVLAKLREWTDPYSDPEATIIEVIGRAGEMKAEIKSIALAHNLPFEFPDDVLAEADAYPEAIPDEVIRERRDLRGMDIFTIDPYDARDFDDAISIEEHAGGDVTLGIHIADVSHYVPEGSALDEEAYRRGTSVYLVTGVIPMLPERLSNNLCSLRPDEDRLAYSVFVRLSPRGAIQEYEITKSVIRSKRRFTYEEALAVLESGAGDYARELAAINSAAHVQRTLRRRKGSVDFDSTELKFRLDENDFPIEVIQKKATESTKLIEDCMLLANRVVAEHIGNERSSKRGGTVAPFVYRIHDSPPKQKLVDLSNFVKQFGYTMPVENVQPKDIQRLIDAARGTDEQEMINEVALRSMAKAVYSEFNIGHFGLAFKHYTHFTSPIRRYPDLIVHRMLNEYGRGMSNDRRQFFAGSLGSLTTHCSERERAAVEAERASIKVAEVQFLKSHVGDVFEGIIGGVMPFGLFVELKRYGIEGLAPVRAMRDDYYHYDERTKSLRGRATKKVYRLGDPVHVRVIRVDEINSQIDLEIIDEEEYLEEGGEERMDVIGDDDADHVGADEVRDERPAERSTLRVTAPAASRQARAQRRPGGSAPRAPSGERGRGRDQRGRGDGRRPAGATGEGAGRGTASGAGERTRGGRGAGAQGEAAGGGRARGDGGRHEGRGRAEAHGEPVRGEGQPKGGTRGERAREEGGQRTSTRGGAKRGEARGDAKRGERTGGEGSRGGARSGRSKGKGRSGEAGRAGGAKKKGTSSGGRRRR